jgi:hypothetical protein
MIYPIHLQTAGFLAGAFLLVIHLVAIAKPAATREWLRQFPRSRFFGTVFVALAAIWGFLLLKYMDMGEFSRLRFPMMIGVAVGGYLTWRYVEEFLAVRALGMLALLAAEPLLGAAFLRPELSKVLLSLLAYVWIGLGLFWVGIPWLLRDQIAWVLARPLRFQVGAWLGAIYGVALLVCAALFWK